MLREKIGSRYLARIRVHSEGCKWEAFVCGNWGARRDLDTCCVRFLPRFGSM
jgi:hypothetical protein